MNCLIVGYGRMGRAIEAQASARGHGIAAIVDPAAAERGCRPEIDEAVCAEADVAFEFTHARQAEANARALLAHRVPVVCGTTGWQPGPELEGAIDSSEVGMVWAPNFSPGMNLFYDLVRQAGARLGASGLYDPWVEERHHRGKLDAPSGTARHIASILGASDPRGLSPAEGHPDGGLAERAFHVSAVRAGREPGTHRVGFDGDQDVILLEHRSRGRSAFALGAVLAAEWIQGRTGLHGFAPVLESFLERGRRGEVDER